MQGFSACLIIFITTFDRYMYFCAPYGISSLSEHYDRCMTKAFTRLTGFQCVVDDIIIYDSDKHQHAVHVWQFLQNCKDRHIETWRSSYKDVTFARFTLSEQVRTQNQPLYH